MALPGGLERMRRGRDGFPSTAGIDHAGMIRLLLVIALCAGSGCAWSATAMLDDAHERVMLEHPARRVIAISPHLAELVHAAGAGKSLVGVVRGADFPPQVLALASVGDAAGLDFERILLLAPDLVLAWGSGNRPADLDRLRRSGVSVVVMEPRLLGDISRHLRIIGQLTGSQRVADEAANAFDARLQALRVQYAVAAPVKVFVEIWHQPLFTVGDTHLLADVLRACGARNAVGSYPLLAGPVPLEDVLIARADVVLSLTGQPEQEARARWQSMLPGGEDGAIEVISVAPELMTRATPRMLDGVHALCERIGRVRLNRLTVPAVKAQ